MNEFLQNRFLKSVLTIFIGLALLFCVGLGIRLIFEPDTLRYNFEEWFLYDMQTPPGIDNLNEWEMKNQPADGKWDEAQSKEYEEKRQEYMKTVLKPLWDKEHKDAKARFWPYFGGTLASLWVIGLVFAFAAIKFDEKLGLLSAGIFFAGTNVLGYSAWAMLFFMEEAQAGLHNYTAGYDRTDPVLSAVLLAVALVATVLVFWVTWIRFVKQDTANIEGSRFIAVLNGLAPLSVLLMSVWVASAYLKMEEVHYTIACFVFACLALIVSVVGRKLLEGISNSLGIAALVASVAAVTFAFSYNRLLSVGIAFLATLVVMYLGWSAFQSKAAEREAAEAVVLPAGGAITAPGETRMVLYGAGEIIPRTARKVIVEVAPGVVFKGFADIQTAESATEPIPSESDSVE